MGEVGALCVLLTAFVWSLAETETPSDDQSCNATLGWVPAFCNKILSNSNINMTRCDKVDRTISDTCRNIPASEDTRENISACNVFFIHTLCKERTENQCLEWNSVPCRPGEAGVNIQGYCGLFRGVCHNIYVYNESVDTCEKACVQKMRWFCGLWEKICNTSSTEPLTEPSSSATMSVSSVSSVTPATSTYPYTEVTSEVADDSNGDDVQIILWITYATLGVMVTVAGIQCVRVIVKRRRRRHKRRRETTSQSETRINSTSFNTDSAITGDSMQDGTYTEITATPSNVRFGQHGAVALNVAQRVSSLEHHYDTVTPLMIGHHEQATPQRTRSDEKQVYSQLCVQTLVEHTYTKLPCNTAANGASNRTDKAGDCTESHGATQNVNEAIRQSKQNADGIEDSGHEYFKLEKDKNCEHSTNSRHGSKGMEENVQESRNYYYTLDKLDKPHEVNVGIDNCEHSANARHGSKGIIDNEQENVNSYYILEKQGKLRDVNVRMDNCEHSTNARDGSISMEENGTENRNPYYVLEKLDIPNEVNVEIDNQKCVYYHKLEKLDDSQGHTIASRSITLGDTAMETRPVCTSGAAAPAVVAGHEDTFLDSGIVDDNRDDLQGDATHYYTLEKQGDSREG